MQEKNNKPPVVRLQGGDKTCLYLKFITEYFKKADGETQEYQRANGELEGQSEYGRNKQEARQIWKELEQETKGGGSRTWYGY